MEFDMEEFEEYVEKTAMILDIDDPVIRVDSDGLLDRNAVGYIKERNIILLSENLIQPQNENKYIETYLIAAHGLRHVWQEKYGYLLDDPYDPSDDMEKCENHPREVDANAFAYLIISTYFDGRVPAKGTWAIYSYDKVLERVQELKRWFDIRMEELFGEDGFVELDEAILPPGLFQRYGHTRIFLNEEYEGLGMAIIRDSGSLPLENQYYHVYYFDLDAETLKRMYSIPMFERKNFTELKEPLIPRNFNDMVDMLSENLIGWHNRNRP